MALPRHCLNDPSFLIVDEPTVGLDPLLRASLWELFRQLTAEGRSIIVTSHTMDDAAHCDRLAFIQEGRVVAQGSPSELRAATGDPDSNLEDAFLYFVRKGSVK